MNKSQDYQDGVYAGYTKAAEESKIRTDALEAELASLREKLAAAEKDAELYKTLRSMHWTDKKLCVIQVQNLNLGAQTYSGDLLDEAIRLSEKEEK